MCSGWRKVPTVTCVQWVEKGNSNMCAVGGERYRVQWVEKGTYSNMCSGWRKVPIQYMFAVGGERYLQ